MSESTRALRRANPRTKSEFAPAVDAASAAVRALIASGAEPRIPRTHRLRAAGASALAASIAAALGALALLTLGVPGGGPTVEDAAAAVRKAATVTAVSAERSGTAAVQITHNGEVWTAKTIRWHGRDLSIETDESEWLACVQRFGSARCGKVGSKFLLVDGMMYGVDAEEGGWVKLGSPDSIDPDSGTTPAETLAAVREDVGGVTLRRITDGMSGLTTETVADGGTIYRGAVAAGLVARETGFKEGESIRVLPFGYVAHGRAEDPAALLDAAIKVSPDGIVREINVTWPGWTYTVSYTGLGETPAPAAPEDAKPLRR